MRSKPKGQGLIDQIDRGLRISALMDDADITEWFDRQERACLTEIESVPADDDLRQVAVRYSVLRSLRKEMQGWVATGHRAQDKLNKGDTYE